MLKECQELQRLKSSKQHGLVEGHTKILAPSPAIHGHGQGIETLTGSQWPHMGNRKHYLPWGDKRLSYAPKQPSKNLTQNEMEDGEARKYKDRGQSRQKLIQKPHQIVWNHQHFLLKETHFFHSLQKMKLCVLLPVMYWEHQQWYSSLSGQLITTRCRVSEEHRQHHSEVMEWEADVTWEADAVVHSHCALPGFSLCCRLWPRKCMKKSIYSSWNDKVEVSKLKFTLILVKGIQYVCIFKFLGKTKIDTFT